MPWKGTAREHLVVSSPVRHAAACCCSGCSPSRSWPSSVRGNLLTEAVRLLPDLLRLVPRLARDRSLPRGVRVRLWLLLGDLAMPHDE